MSKLEKQRSDADSPDLIAGVDQAARLLGALAGKAKEAPDCWNPCEETEQLFFGTETTQV